MSKNVVSVLSWGKRGQKVQGEGGGEGRGGGGGLAYNAAHSTDLGHTAAS